MLKNKKGQIAESVTWVVATMIIVVTLIVFIFISTTLSHAKDISLKNAATKVGSFFVGKDIGSISRLETKTTFALSLNDKNKEVINDWIEKK